MRNRWTDGARWLFGSALAVACGSEASLGKERDASAEAEVSDAGDSGETLDTPTDLTLDGPEGRVDGAADAAADALDAHLDAPGELARDAVDARPDAALDAPEAPSDGGALGRGAPCTRDSECAVGVCHPFLRRCGERCDRGLAATCPAGTTCVIPGDSAGVCMATCTPCAASACPVGYRCAGSRLGEPGSPTACVPEDLTLPRPTCGDGGCACGPESCGGAACGRSPCGYLCGACAPGMGCFGGRCTATCPGTPCLDVTGQGICEGGRGAERCPGNASSLRLCTCSGGGPTAWINCATSCACTP
ncbi:MAG: hypothetical protein HY909_19655 [Deltaproteobacteria bacterium]|nr:hypothetical protein [Deltaproteobacteria bacterium]